MTEVDTTSLSVFEEQDDVDIIYNVFSDRFLSIANSPPSKDSLNKLDIEQALQTMCGQVTETNVNFVDPAMFELEFPVTGELNQKSQLLVKYDTPFVFCYKSLATRCIFTRNDPNIDINIQNYICFEKDQAVTLSIGKYYFYKGVEISWTEDKQSFSHITRLTQVGVAWFSSFTDAQKPVPLRVRGNNVRSLVLVGPNDSGKSSLISTIFNALESISSDRNKLVEHALWDKQKQFVELEFELTEAFVTKLVSCILDPLYVFVRKKDPSSLNIIDKIHVELRPLVSVLRISVCSKTVIKFPNLKMRSLSAILSPDIRTERNTLCSWIVSQWNYQVPNLKISIRQTLFAYAVELSEKLIVKHLSKSVAIIPQDRGLFSQSTSSSAFMYTVQRLATDLQRGSLATSAQFFSLKDAVKSHTNYELKIVTSLQIIADCLDKLSKEELQTLKNHVLQCQVSKELVETHHSFQLLLDELLKKYPLISTWKWLNQYPDSWVPYFSAVCGISVTLDKMESPEIKVCKTLKEKVILEIPFHRSNGLVQEFIQIFSMIHFSNVGTLIFDEPGISLHPPKRAVLRRLLHTKYLINKSVIISTHLVEMLGEDVLANTYHCRYIDGSTVIVPVQSQDLTDSFFVLEPMYRPILFSEQVLFVEGYTDDRIISAIQLILEEKFESVQEKMKNFKWEEIFKWNVIRLEGCSKITGLTQLIKTIGMKCKAIFDEDTLVALVNKSSKINNETEVKYKVVDHTVTKLVKELNNIENYNNLLNCGTDKVKAIELSKKLGIFIWEKPEEVFSRDPKVALILNRSYINNTDPSLLHLVDDKNPKRYENAQAWVKKNLHRGNWKLIDYDSLVEAVQQATNSNILDELYNYLCKSSGFY